MFNKVNAKEASISIEVSLSVLLASAVLILALGLFSQSLKAMAFNSNMTNFFKNNTAKTANTYIDKNPTANRVTVAQIPQGQNTLIVGDQGLKGMHSAAQRAIEQLASITTPLTKEQLTNLALQLTILGVSGTDFPNVELGKTFTSNGQKMSYLDLATKNGIIINYFKNTTTVGTQPYDWTNDNTIDGGDPTAGEQYRLANIDAIKAQIK